MTKYNRKRKKYVAAGGDQKKLKVGDLVRIQLLYGKDKAGVGFKSYKNKTFSKRTYPITKITKNAIPVKIRVNRKWYTRDKVIHAEEEDDASNLLIAKREVEENERITVEMNRDAARIIAEAPDDKPRPKRRRKRKDAVAEKLKQEEEDRLIREHEEELPMKKRKPEPKPKRKPKRKPKKTKQQREDEQEWRP